MSHSVMLAHVLRNGFIESVHYGHAVILNADGSIAAAWGEPERPVMPRSSAKPIQAVAMVRAGLDLDGSDLAIVASSHSGEPMHVEKVRSLLEAAGLSELDLQNTPGLPTNELARHAWLASGARPSRVTANCSGKHTGMLLTSLVLGAPTKSYREQGHPVQQVAFATIEDLSGDSISAHGVDGCGAPVVAISLVGLARAFSRIATGDPGSAEGRVARAMNDNPAFVGGTGRDVTVFMAGMAGAIAKDGAEGVHVVALPDGRAAALKIGDGSERARACVAAGLLARLGVDPELVAQVGSEPILGGGKPVGQVRELL